jgi:hypothetical protein
MDKMGGGRGGVVLVGDGRTCLLPIRGGVI